MAKRTYRNNVRAEYQCPPNGMRKSQVRHQLILEGIKKYRELEKEAKRTKTSCISRRAFAEQQKLPTSTFMTQMKRETSNIKGALSKSIAHFSSAQEQGLIKFIHQRISKDNRLTRDEFIEHVLQLKNTRTNIRMTRDQATTWFKKFKERAGIDSVYDNTNKCERLIIQTGKRDTYLPAVDNQVSIENEKDKEIVTVLSSQTPNTRSTRKRQLNTRIPTLVSAEQELS